MFLITVFTGAGFKKDQEMQCAGITKLDSFLKFNLINIMLILKNTILAFTRLVQSDGKRITRKELLRIRALAFGVICAGWTLTAFANTATTPVQVISPLNADSADLITDPFDGSDGLVPRPQPRPDYADSLAGTLVDIEEPAIRPDLAEILPEATASIAQMVKMETGLKTGSVFDLVLSSGDTLAKILKKARFTNQDIAEVSSALGSNVDLRKLQIGTRFTAALDDDGRAVGLQLHNPGQQNPNPAFRHMVIDHYVLRHDLIADDSLGTKQPSWQAIRAIRPMDIKTVHAGNEISLSLYDAAQEVQIPLPILDEFVRVMGFSVDFQREVQQGDLFELVYDMAIDRHTQDPLNSGRLQYAGIVLSGKKMGFYRFTHPDGKEGWYDRNGDSAVRTLMRTPVNGARLSSGFGMRRHPVTGYNAMHRGIDFSVPRGTPILAAGTGHIEMAGWNGSYGRYIRIRHNSTYKTAYAHLSRIAPHIRSGQPVQQGEVIGYVGSSGRSTGPHLHYEILVNNRKLNPLTVKLPTGEGLPEELKEAFRKTVLGVESKMRDSITPLYAGISLQQAALVR